MADILIVGGTSGIGRELAVRHSSLGESVVITGRDAANAARVAAEVQDQTGKGAVRGLALDLSEPGAIGTALADVQQVRSVALVAIERDRNTVAGYDINAAVRLTTLKLVGYTTVVHTLRERITRDGSVLLFGGLAKDAPYPGSTTVSTVNAGVMGLVATLSRELAPVRVNALHPGAVEDSPYWADNTQALDIARSRTISGRLATMADVVDAAAFLLGNPAVNGVNLDVGGGIA